MTDNNETTAATTSSAHDDDDDEGESNNNKEEEEERKKPFPMKARVVLHGLKAEEFNGKTGTILGGGLNAEGRQQVHVEELDKNVALKLANLSYQERQLDSLSVKELKKILQYKEVLLKFQGLDKSDLQEKLQTLSTDPMEIAEWLAHASAGGSGGSSADDSSSAESGKKKGDGRANTNTNLQAGLDQFENMTPQQLRQQAQMMRSMPPSQLRTMDPQLAGMTDSQIQQAASQLEMMASNPQMMHRMREQMKNMTPQQRQQYEQMMGRNGAAGGRAAGAGGTNANQNPQDMLANMDPEQLRQQA